MVYGSFSHKQESSSVYYILLLCFFFHYEPFCDNLQTVEYIFFFEKIALILVLFFINLVMYW